MLILPALIFSSVHAESGKARYMTTERNYKTPQLSIKETTIIGLPENFNEKLFDQLNDKIGPVYPSHSKVHHIKSTSSMLIFETDYVIGEYGLRVHSRSQQGTKHMILAGDSNIFGEGCSEQETMFAHLGNIPALADFQLYNFGHRGGGPHNTLSLIEHYPYTKLIREKQGYFFYQFFPAHMIERVIGAKNYVGWDQGRSPWYDLNEKNELIYKGSFRNRMITSLYQKMAGYDFLNWLFPSLPRISSPHLKLVAKVFERMKNIYQRDFPQGKFVVVLNEHQPSASAQTLELQNELKKLNIETALLAAAPLPIEKYTFKDMHLNPEGQKWMADLLGKEILKIFSLH